MNMYIVLRNIKLTITYKYKVIAFFTEAVTTTTPAAVITQTTTTVATTPTPATQSKLITELSARKRAGKTGNLYWLNAQE